MRTLGWLTLVLVAATLSGCGFGKYKCKSKQSEAKSNLMSLRTTMEMINVEKGQYAQSLADVKAEGFVPMGEYYEYEVTASGEKTFVAQARGKGDMAGDVWKIDQTGKLSAVDNKCD